MKEACGDRVGGRSGKEVGEEALYALKRVSRQAIVRREALIDEWQ